MSIKLYSNELLKQMPKGIFLTAKEGNNVNTMTIGWASVVVLWEKPIFLMLVNPSAYTYELIKKTNEFTISVPKFDTMKEELMFCGTKSGRDLDKFKEGMLDIATGKEIDVPIIDNCEINYECKVIHNDYLKLDKLDKELTDEIPTMFYGEIVASYK